MNTKLEISLLLVLESLGLMDLVVYIATQDIVVMIGIVSIQLFLAGVVNLIDWNEEIMK